MADMASLSSYDKGKMGHDNRRYLSDIHSVQDANERLWSEVRKTKKKQPRKIFLMGNHEDRITRAVERFPQLEGTLSTDDFDLQSFGWEVHPFKQIIKHQGVNISHYFESGVMGRPIGGEHPAYMLLTKKFESCVQGHTHTLDWCRRTNSSGKAISGLVAGCFMEHTPEWVGQARDMYWRGVITLNNTEDGEYDLSCVSLSRLKAEYSVN